MTELKRLLNIIRPICSAYRQGKPVSNKDLKMLSIIQQEIESKDPFFKKIECDCKFPRVKRYVNGIWRCIECGGIIKGK